MHHIGFALPLTQAYLVERKYTIVEVGSAQSGRKNGQCGLEDIVEDIVSTSSPTW